MATTYTRRFSDICKGCGEEVDFFNSTTGAQVKMFWHDGCRPATQSTPTPTQSTYVEDTTALQAGYAASANFRDAQPEVYYGSGPGPDIAGGCSCTPTNGPDCWNCT